MFLVSLAMGQAVMPALAAGEEVTRPQYVESSEPICKANTLASRHILAGIREDVREGHLSVAGHKFARAAKALASTIRRLEQLPQPAADEERLTRWFEGLQKEVSLLEKVSTRLKKGSSKNLGRYVLELRHQANVTNNIVLTFGFEYCLIQTARYL